MPKLTCDRSQRVSDRILKFFRCENEITGTHTSFYENIRVEFSPPLNQPSNYRTPLLAFVLKSVLVFLIKSDRYKL